MKKEEEERDDRRLKGFKSDSCRNFVIQPCDDVTHAGKMSGQSQGRAGQGHLYETGQSRAVSSAVCERETETERWAVKLMASSTYVSFLKVKGEPDDPKAKPVGVSVRLRRLKVLL